VRSAPLSRLLQPVELRGIPPVCCSERSPLLLSLFASGHSFSPMKQSVFLLVLLSCMFCEGQSVLTTPTEWQRSVPGSASPPTNGADSMSVRDPQQVREKTDLSIQFQISLTD
jgi:hypothetical protein